MIPHRARPRGPHARGGPNSGPQGNGPLPPDIPPLERGQSKRQWLNDRYALLVLFGTLAMTPPLLMTVNKALLIFGVPLLYFWLASVWLALIVGIFWLNRRLQVMEMAKKSATPPPSPPEPPPRPQIPPLND